MIESHSDHEAKLKRGALCLSACGEISDKDLELILKCGGFSQMATARLARQNERLIETLRRIQNVAMSRSESHEWIFGYTTGAINRYENESNSTIAESVIPDGYKLVPVEPTNEMCDDAFSFLGLTPVRASEVYRTMIAAAPEPKP